MQILYINLARRADRRSFMADQLQRLGLAATRIEAATPADLGLGAGAARPPHVPRAVSPGDLACVASHERAWRAFLESADPYALVLEDDALLSSRLPAFLAAFEALAPRADMVRIESSGSGTRVKRVACRIEGIDLARPYGWEGGAAGYIVSRRAAGLLLDTPATRRKSLDEVLFDPFGPLAGELVRWQALNGLVVQAHLSARPDLIAFGSSDLRPIRWASPKPMSRLERDARRLATLWQREIVAGSQRTFHQLLGAKKRAIPFLP